jgi:hypothetical protein
MNLAQPFKAGKDIDHYSMRRVSDAMRINFTRRYATAPIWIIAIPALKGRAKLMLTLRVAKFLLAPMLVMNVMFAFR